MVRFAFSLRVCGTAKILLQLWLRRRQLSCRTHRFETSAAMRAVAERFVLGLPAAAQTDGGAPRQVERLSFHIVNRKLALDLNRAVIVDRDLR